MVDNTITVVGNLTRDPELRYTQTGTARALLGVAVNRRWVNRRTQETEESVSFFNVICWDTLAQNVADSLSKGQRVIVTGRLEQRSYDTQEGEKRSVVEIVAQEIAPSLRWASAQVMPNPRNRPDDGGFDQRRGGGGGGGSYNDASGGFAPATGDAAAPGQQEEPF